MQDWAQAHPEDADALALAAEALSNLQPWCAALPYLACVPCPAALRLLASSANCRVCCMVLRFLNCLNFTYPVLLTCPPWQCPRNSLLSVSCHVCIAVLAHTRSLPQLAHHSAGPCACSLHPQGCFNPMQSPKKASTPPSPPILTCLCSALCHPSLPFPTCAFAPAPAPSPLSAPPASVLWLQGQAPLNNACARACTLG